MPTQRPSPWHPSTESIQATKIRVDDPQYACTPFIISISELIELLAETAEAHRQDARSAEAEGDGRFDDILKIRTAENDASQDLDEPGDRQQVAGQVNQIRHLLSRKHETREQDAAVWLDGSCAAGSAPGFERANPKVFNIISG